MNEKDKEYEEYFKIFEQKSTRQARQNTVTPRPTAQNRMPPRPRQQIPRKRQSPRKRRQKKRRIAIISSLAAILLIVCIVLICKSCTGNHDLAALQGAWHYDEYTEYEFDGKGNGCMCLDEENHFEFTYSVDGDKSVCQPLFQYFLSGKSYMTADWTQLYFSNPVLKNISKLVVWSQGDDTFTVAGNGLITVEALPYTLSEEEINLAHPMEMDEDAVAAWQKYFASNNLKQPFDQVWEPVIDFEKVSSDRYTGCEIPLYRFNEQEKHGITLEKSSEYDYIERKYEYTSLDIILRGCRLDWEMTTGDKLQAFVKVQLL